MIGLGFAARGGAQPLVVTTIAAGTSAEFSFELSGIAVDSAGDIFVADTANQVIKEIPVGGVVQLFAGTLDKYGSADGVTGVGKFNNPVGLAIDSAGNLYVADEINSTIRKITPAGIMSTIAGVTGATGNVDGPAATATFGEAKGLAIDAAGNVYIADSGNHSVRKISPAGVVSTVVKITNGYGWLNGICVDPSGNLYVSDGLPDTSIGPVTGGQVIYKISPSGVLTIFAGQLGVAGASDGAATAAQFNGPWGVAADGAGNIYVADANNSTIRLITPSGTVATVAGSASSLANLVDGAGGAAIFNHPSGIAVDKFGLVLIVDSFNNAVRRGIRSTNTQSPVRFLNLSSMGNVGSPLPLSSGFIVGGTASQTVLIRAVGPTLKQFGVAQPLAGPQLDLYGPGGVHLATTANGVNAVNIQSAASMIGAFPIFPSLGDAGMVVSLGPGAYTAQITGPSGNAGAALLEVYEIP